MCHQGHKSVSQSKHEARVLSVCPIYRSIDFLLPECQQSTQWEFNWANYRGRECWELSHILSCFRPPSPRPPPCPSWAPITQQHPGFKHSLQCNLQLTEMLTIFSQSITNLYLPWKPDRIVGWNTLWDKTIYSLLFNEWEGQKVRFSFRLRPSDSLILSFTLSLLLNFLWYMLKNIF